MNKRKNDKARTLGLIFVMIIIGFGIIKIYDSTMKHSKTSVQEQLEQTEVEILAKKDLVDNYPATPREVVKVYLRIISCFYNENLSDEEIETLAKQARLLFDMELNEHNSWEQYLVALKDEIIDYRQKQTVIDEYTVQSGSAIRHYMKEEQEYASVVVNITTRDEQERYYTCEEFILRKDNDGNYKILGWRLTEDSDLDEH